MQKTKEQEYHKHDLHALEWAQVAVYSADSKTRQGPWLCHRWVISTQEKVSSRGKVGGSSWYEAKKSGREKKMYIRIHCECSHANKVLTVFLPSSQVQMAPNLWALPGLHELVSHQELGEFLVGGTKQDFFSSNPGVEAMLSLWVSSPIFPRYLLLPSIPGKPAHSAGLHTANICSLQTLLVCHHKYLFFLSPWEKEQWSDFTRRFWQAVKTTF